MRGPRRQGKGIARVAEAGIVMVMSETLVQRMTAEELIGLAESGAISCDARIELLEGLIVDMLPIGPFHGDILGWFTDEFGRLNQGRWSMRVQDALHLDKDSLPQPDLMLLQRQRYRPKHPGPNNVFLLIEVADSSLKFDKTAKVPLYARAGIREVWVVNVPDTLVEVYRDPTPTGYRTQRTVQIGGTVSPLAFPDVVLKTSDISSEE